MQKPKQTWDTRAWLIGILGGIVCGSIGAWSLYPPIMARLDSFSTPFIGHQSAEVISIVFGLIGLLVLPGLLSGLAQRWTFLWRVVPLVMLFASIELKLWAVRGINSTTRYFWAILAVFGVCWVISSGPVSLFRWLRVRAAQRHMARLALVTAQQKAASVPQEGVWPPPPEYREEIG